MNDIESYLTPYKYGKPILAPSGIKGEFDCYGADNARIFRHHGKIYLMYIGFDGEGYQTALATTEDMVNFKKLGVILGKDKASKLQKGGRAVSCLLCDVDLYGNRNLIKVDNKYWLFYHAYPETMLHGPRMKASSIGIVPTSRYFKKEMLGSGIAAVFTVCGLSRPMMATECIITAKHS